MWTLIVAGLALVSAGGALVGVRVMRRRVARDAVRSSERLRRATAATDELRVDLDRLHDDLARMAARIERDRHRGDLC